MNRVSFSYIAQLILLFLIYVISGRIGLGLDAVSGFATYVWLPTGISLAVLFAYGYRLWPAVFVGALVVNYLSDAPLVLASGIALGNTLEAIVGVFLLRKVGFHPSLETVRDVVKLLFFGAILSTVVSSTIGVSVLILGGQIPESSFAPTWTAWWVGDAISNVLVAPVLFVWSGFAPVRIRPSRLAELICLLTTTIIVGILVFQGFYAVQIKQPPVTHLMYIPLIWAALRFSPRITINILFFLMGIAVWGTFRGEGPFARGTLAESLFFLQSFMGITGITFLMLSSAVWEKKQFEKRKDDFISIASHELKAPITSIKIFARLTQASLGKKKNSPQIRYLGRIDSQLNKLVRLVNDLLDLSKIQSQKLDLRKERFSLQSLIKETVEELQSTTNKHKITVKNSLRAKKEIYADRERIGQVLINLISNAIKYSPKAHKIFVEAKALPGKVIISVRDSGLGIPCKEEAHIFSLFYRTGDAEKKQSGLGIGLYLSRRIIELHRGEIWFKSAKGKGSTFYFSLPA